MATKGPALRAELSCRALANSSLPTPDSPSSKTAMSLSATRRALVAAAPQRTSPVSSWASASGAGVVPTGCARTDKCGSICTVANKARPCTVCSASAPPAARCALAMSVSMVQSNTWCTWLAPMSTRRRPSISSARRLAPTSQPSLDSASTPWATEPMPSARACRRSTIWCWQADSTSLFSIMRAAVDTRPRVWGWRLRWSPEMSKMPISAPVADTIGEAAQVKKPLRSR